MTLLWRQQTRAGTKSAVCLVDAVLGSICCSRRSSGTYISVQHQLCEVRHEREALLAQVVSVLNWLLWLQAQLQLLQPWQLSQTAVAHMVVLQAKRQAHTELVCCWNYHVTGVCSLNAQMRDAW